MSVSCSSKHFLATAITHSAMIFFVAVKENKQLLLGQCEYPKGKLLYNFKFMCLNPKHETMIAKCCSTFMDRLSPSYAAFYAQSIKDYIKEIFT